LTSAFALELVLDGIETRDKDDFTSSEENEIVLTDIELLDVELLEIGIFRSDEDNF
jgi:hypothetical protein